MITRDSSVCVLHLRLSGLCALLLCLSPLHAQEAGKPPSDMIRIGAAKVDITPDFPVLLAGYGARTEESQGVAQPLWARALAIFDSGDDNPALLIAVDNCGVPRAVTESVAERLATSGVKRERFVICATHTHCAPTLTGYAPVIWAGRDTEAQRERVDRYTKQLEDQLVELAQAALAEPRPCELAWAQGRVTFAGNRRVVDENGRYAGFGFSPDGPVDHSLPVMTAKDADGKILAVWTNYACHCTTLGPQNHIHGDWAGCANAAIETHYPDAVALTTIGCGADANPEPRGEAAMAERYGKAVAEEVTQLLDGKLTRLQAPLTSAMREVMLPFETIPDREYWEAKKAEGGFVGQHAIRQLERLDRGEELPRELPYPITTWTFGDDLGIVFLAGEVVVDYSIRLKRELDWKRLWLNAWANAIPGYIPSRRILSEGGYEADSSQIYYDQPARYAPEVEDIVVNTVKEMLGKTYEAPDEAAPAPFHRHPEAEDPARPSP